MRWQGGAAAQSMALDMDGLFGARGPVASMRQRLRVWFEKIQYSHQSIPHTVVVKPSQTSDRARHLSTHLFNYICSRVPIQSEYGFVTRSGQYFDPSLAHMRALRQFTRPHPILNATLFEMDY